jgi:DNA-binding MarR family transcriptional regulator
MQARASVLLRPLGLSLPQYICLQILRVIPDASNATLAREAFVSRQAMNAVLRSLEEAGLVTRPEAATSGRVLPARLTKAGESTVTKAVKAIRVAEDQMLDGLHTRERRELKRLLARCVANSRNLHAD